MQLPANQWLRAFLLPSQLGKISRKLRFKWSSFQRAEHGPIRCGWIIIV